MGLNEATLEARIDHILRIAFPTFAEVGLVHQQSFTIRLGHHNLIVDLKEPSIYPTKAIFDVLLTVNNVNAILLELKEGHPIKNEDIDQGISYARLIHPMPPLVLVSNGQENLFFNSYTKERLTRINSINLGVIESLIDSSFSLAINDFKHAIDLLLNKQPELFSRVINQISAQKFERLSGTLKNIAKPICRDFQIPREIIHSIYKGFNEGNNLIGLIGPAFSGKTTTLYQFYKEYSSHPNHFVLFIDCLDVNYSIFQQLANHFSSRSQTSVTIDKIREWINNALHGDVDSRFFLIVDNFTKETPDNVRNDIIELIDQLNGTKHGILYSIDEISYKQLTSVSNRNYQNTIGSNTKLFALDELNNEEFTEASRLLFDSKIAISVGGHFCPEYRQPRILRQLAVFYSNTQKKDQLQVIAAVPDFQFLMLFGVNEIFTNDIHNYVFELVEAFIDDEDVRLSDSELRLAAIATGAINVETYKKKFPQKYPILIQSGLILEKEYASGLRIIIPKLPELFAYHGMLAIFKMIKKLHIDKQTNENIIDCILKQSYLFPYGDLIAAGVIMKIGRELDVSLFSHIINKLLDKIPYSNPKILSERFKIMDRNDYLNVGMLKGTYPVDWFPYFVLSQIAGYPLRLINDTKHEEYAFHLMLLKELGSVPEPMQRGHYYGKRKEIKYFTVTDLGKYGSFIATENGIIEPIVQSIQNCFLQIPDQIIVLCKDAIDNNNIQLLWRINLAVIPLVDISDKVLSEKAQFCTHLFTDFLTDYFKDVLRKEKNKEI